jgi:hypothetical protein
MKKGITLIVALLFVVSLTSMLPSVDASIPTEIEGRPYYFNDYERKSSTTSVAQFGQVMNWGNTGIVGNWYLNGYMFATSDPDGGPFYLEGVFDCGEWAAYHEWLFEGMGYDTRFVTDAGHAWIEVLLSDGEWHDYEPFEYEMGCMDYHTLPGNVIGYTIQDFKAEYGESEVDWWNPSVSWGNDKAALAINGMPAPDPYPEENYGVFRNGYWYLDTNGDQQTDEIFKFGLAGDTPINFGGKYTIFRNGYWYVQGEDRFKFGIAGDKPVTFDNGDYGVLRNGWWYMDTDGDQIVDETFKFGLAGDTPINFGGYYAIFRNGYWYIDYNGDHIFDETFKFGMVGDKPIVFDNGDYGVLRNGWWYIDTDGDQIVDETFKFGIGGDTPFAIEIVK